jgi:hypothetical protein
MIKAAVIGVVAAAAAIAAEMGTDAIAFAAVRSGSAIPRK